MKFEDFESFEKGLSSTVPVVAIVASDDFERKCAVELLKKHLSVSEFSLRVFHGESLSIEDVLKELESSSLWAERSVVVIMRADKLKQSNIDEIFKYCSRPNPDHCLVLVAEKLLATSKLIKQVDKVGVVLRIPVEKAWQKEKTLVTAMVRQAHEAGKALDMAAAQSIVKQVGVDGTLAEKELEKIICYVGDKGAITNDDVARVCSSLDTTTIWQLGEAIFRLQGDMALSIGKELLTAGASAVALLAQLRKQIQNEYEVCSILAAGGGPQEVTKAFGYMRGRVLQQHVEMAKNYGLQRFKAALIAVDDTATAVRNTSTDPAVLVEMLLVKLAA